MRAVTKRISVGAFTAPAGAQKAGKRCWVTEVDGHRMSMDAPTKAEAIDRGRREVRRRDDVAVLVFWLDKIDKDVALLLEHMEGPGIRINPRRPVQMPASLQGNEWVLLNGQRRELVKKLERVEDCLNRIPGGGQ